MDYSRAREQLKPFLKDYVESVTGKSRSGMYICPIPNCGSGTGKNHTGAFSINSKDPTRWKCFSCGESGDIFDLIGLVENIKEPQAQLKRAGELFGVAIEGDSIAQKQPKKGREENMHTNTYTHADNYLDYFRKCNSRLKETDYRRGISEEVANRFMLGYDSHYTKSTGGAVWKALIIPTSQHSYVARNTDTQADKNNRYRKTGNTTPLNAKALQTATKPIFIVEGELDALSIIEVGGIAVSLGSTANIDNFTNNYLKKQKPAQPLIIALDNDESGKQGTEKLARKLEELEIPFYRVDPYNGKKDANESLLADRDAFTQAIRQAESLEEEAQETEKEEYLKSSSASHLQEFINGIADSVNTPAQPTGFTKLDDVLDGGLYEGLYVLGAITSLGKTSFTLQIADSIAQSGKDVIIFSLEMARSELMAKSISRHTLLGVMRDPKGDIRNAKTARGITAGKKYATYNQKERELIQQAIRDYGKYAQHIYIHEGLGNLGTDYIRETIKKHILFTGQVPVAVIDYLQLLAPADVRATDKQNMDKNVMELKRISRDFKTPVIAISSFNRDNYAVAVNTASFKESGSVEYSSDVLIGLQLKGAGSNGFNVSIAMSKIPREIEVCILKQRNGKTGDKIPFSYYQLFNYFEEA